VNTHFLCSREYLEHKPMLQQRLAAADGQSALHRLQVVAVFLNLLHRAR